MVLGCFQLRGILERFIRFCGMGFLATIVHVLVVLFLVEVLLVGPVWATVIAFCLALGVSFLGARLWVLRMVVSFPSFGRFFLVSLVSCGFNVAGMYFVVEVLLLNYLWGIIWACCLVPLITFISHNYWTFGMRS
jgi:putative flippase GtrA